MAYPTLRSASAEMSLDGVITHLRDRRDVVGVATLGSTATEKFSSASDIDLLIVLETGAAALAVTPFEVVYTHIDQRSADVILTTEDALARLAAGDWSHPLPSAEYSLVRWIRRGRVLFDRHDVLTSIAKRKEDPVPWTDSEQVNSWWSLNFALVKASRYWASGETGYRRATAWIVHTHLNEAVVAYFVARHLPWDGERAAIAFLEEHDPEFLAAVERFLTPWNDAVRLQNFARIVHLALSRGGEVWPAGTGPTSDAWETLMADDESRETDEHRR